jgi:hypothetical protein
MPASKASCARRIAVSGDFSEGLSTTLLPAAKAGPNFHDDIRIGKFYGTTAATTPIGSRVKVPPGGGSSTPLRRRSCRSPERIIRRNTTRPAHPSTSYRQWLTHASSVSSNDSSPRCSWIDAALRVRVFIDASQSNTTPLDQTHGDASVYGPAITSMESGHDMITTSSSPAVYNDSQFAKQGVVFVSFNYRLGRFGFFAHPRSRPEIRPD